MKLERLQTLIALAMEKDWPTNGFKPRYKP